MTDIAIDVFLNLDASKSAKDVRQKVEAALKGIDLGVVLQGTKQTSGFQKTQEEAVKLLREINKSTAAAKPTALGSIFTGAFEGFGRNLTKFLEKPLLNIAKTGTSFGQNLTGAFNGKIGLDPAINALNELLIDAVLDAGAAIKGDVTFGDISKVFVASLKENGDTAKKAIDTVTQNIKNFDEGITIALESAVETLKTSVDLKGFSQALDAKIRQRTERFQDKALELVYQRAEEIISQSRGKEGTKGIDKARELIDQGKSSRVGKLVGSNAPEVIQSETEKLLITIGGFGGAITGFRIAAQEAVDAVEKGRNDLAFLAVKTEDIAKKDVKDPNLDRLAGLSKLTNPILKGFSKEEVELAAQALAGLISKQGLEVKLLGESGGGFIVERAVALLNKAGYGGQIKGFGTATPQFPGALNPPNYQSVLGTNAQEGVGAEIKRVFSSLDLVNFPDTERQVSDAKDHLYEGYKQVAELQNFLADLPPPKIDESNVVAYVAQIQKVLNQVTSGDTDVGSGIKQLQSLADEVNALKRFAVDDNVLQSVVSIQKDLNNLIKSPINLLKEASNKIEASLATVSSAVEANSPQINSILDDLQFDLQKTIIQLLKASTNSASEAFKERAKTLASQTQSVIGSGVFAKDIAPDIRRQQLQSIQVKAEPPSQPLQIDDARIVKITDIIVEYLGEVNALAEKLPKTSLIINQEIKETESQLSLLQDLAVGNVPKIESLQQQAKSILTGVSASYSQIKDLIKVGDIEGAAQLSSVVASLRVERATAFDKLVSELKQIDSTDKATAAAISATINAINSGKGNASRISNLINQTFKQQILTEASPELKREIFESFKETGSQALAGLILGLNPKGIALQGERAGDFLLQGIKDALGIASPAAEIIRQIGKPIRQALDIIAAAAESSGNAIGKNILGGIKNTVGVGTAAALEAADIAKSIKPTSFEQIGESLISVGESVEKGIKQGRIDLLTAQINELSQKARELEKSLIAGFDPAVANQAKTIREEIGKLNSEIDKIATSELPNFAKQIKDNFKDFLKDPLQNLRQFGKAALSAGVGVLALQFFDLQSAIFAVQDGLRKFSEFESINQAIINTASSAEQGTQSLLQLRQQTDDLKVSFSAAAKGLAQLQAATQNTPSAALVPKLSEGLLQAARAYSLTADQLDRANVAIAQSFSKGVVSQEELRGQLSEALPNAIQVAARAYGVTVQELNKLVAQGELSSIFFAKFSRQLRDETAVAAAQSIGTLTASLADLQNQFDLLSVSLIQSVAPTIKSVVDLLAGLLRVGAENAGIASAAIKSLGVLILAAFAPALKLLGGLAIRFIGLQPVFTALGSAVISLQTGFTAAAVSLRTGLVPALTSVGVGAAQAAAGIGKLLAPLALLVARTLIYTELISQGINLFSLWGRAGQSAAAGVDAIRQAQENGIDTSKQYLSAQESVRNNIAAFNKDLPFFVAQASLFARARIAKEVEEQGKLLSTGNQLLTESLNTLSQVSKGREVDAKTIELQISQLTRLQAALESEKILNGSLAEDKRKQLADINKLLPKLKEQADLAAGIGTTFGEINRTRAESIAQATAAEVQGLTAISELEAAQLGNKTAIERQKREITLSRISAELSAQKQALSDIQRLSIALPEDEKLREERIKTEETITKLTKDQAEARIAIRQNEYDENLKELEKYLDELTRATESATKAERLLNQQKFNDRKISAEELARREEALDNKALDNRIDNINKSIAAAESADIQEEERTRRIGDLKSQLADVELEKAKKIGDAITRRYEREKEAAGETAEIKKESLENEKRQLEAILAIEDARNNLINARQNLATSRGDLEVARLERARDIVKQLNEDENLSAEQRLGLQRELGALGIQSATSELSLAQQIAQIELATAKRKEESAKLQNEQALKRLEIETKIAELAAKQAVLTAKEKIVEAEGKLAETLQDPTATKQEKGNAQERLRLAKEGLELAKLGQKEVNKLKLEELKIQQQINEEQRKQDELFRQLNRQREIAAGKTDIGRNPIIPLAPSGQLQQKPTDYNPVTNGLNELKKVLLSIDSKLRTSPQEVNVTTVTGIDGKQIGRDVAKQLRELNNAVFK